MLEIGRCYEVNVSKKMYLNCASGYMCVGNCVLCPFSAHLRLCIEEEKTCTLISNTGLLLHRTPQRHGEN